MRLTSHTDYGLRVLMSLATMNDRLVTIEELAVRHRVSRNHLMKVAQSLVSHGLVEGVRGRGGGLTLAKAPAEIRMGQVVRTLEADFELVACLGESADTCIFTGVCRLTSALRTAMEAFFSELDRLTLADLVTNRAGIRQRLASAS